MRTLLSFVGLTIAVAQAGSASAAVTVYNGDTTGLPTYNRLLEDLSGLSAIGTAVRYDTRTFSVTQSGDYDFTSAAGFDPFMFLYSPGFNPVAPLVNARIGNDDLLGLNSSGFSFSLTAGVNYTLVMTGFGNTDFGGYTVSIGGEGDFSPIASGAQSPDIFARTGSTTGGPTYNRPLEDLSALSDIGTATPYDVFGFTVDTTGDYEISSSSEFDNFLTIYQFAFNPNAALTNALVANDDLVGLHSSGVSVTLTAGVNYFAVMTGFGNSDSGRYSLQAAGAGRLTAINGAIPEPSAWAMMILGFGIAGAALRRRPAGRQSIMRSN